MVIYMHLTAYKNMSSKMLVEGLMPQVYAKGS